MAEKGLNRDQLKIIAVIAMIVDHTAWGFVDFMSPLGQIMHIFGRLTLPIMCFFVAEGYRHTASKRRYLSRMASFAIVSIIPFYMFFHEEYDYRQNIIFDLFLALLALCIMERKQLHIAVRIALVGLILAISLGIGGWVVMPVVYVLIFYYGKDFKTKAIYFSVATVALVVILSILIVLNQQYHYIGYDWNVEERLYLIGFVLALFPISLYNGQKGKNFGGRYFFYVVYPAHFVVLYLIKSVIEDFSWQKVYIYSHLLALIICLSLLFFVIRQPVSRAQMGVTFFLTAGVMYIFGFLLEVTMPELPAVLTAAKIQYFAEAMVMMGATFCVQELCHFRIPRFVYAIEATVSVFTLYGLFMYPGSDLMYKNVVINTTAGAFPRMEVQGYGIAFYLFMILFAAVCVMMVGIGVYSARRGSQMLKKRLRLLLFAMLSIWITYLVKLFGLTGGYEVPAVFILFSSVFLMIALVKYSFLDSVTLDFSNAINQGRQGLIAIDDSHRILYHTQWIYDLFGEIHNYEDAYRIDGISDFFEGNRNVLEKDGHVYEMRVEPLIEQGYQTGKMLWILDQTEHYKYVSELEHYSIHDDLTGLHTRQWFEDNVTEKLKDRSSGAFFMVDMDRFKAVNDIYGHQAGDAVLRSFAKTVMAKTAELGEDVLLSGRLGGDEFSLFYCGSDDPDAMFRFGNSLIPAFDEELSVLGYKNLTSISVGIVMVTPERCDYSTLYECADKALYKAKDAGRKTCRMY